MMTVTLHRRLTKEQSSKPVLPANILSGRLVTDCCRLLAEVGGEWEDGNLTPTRPASATAEEAGEWEDGNLTPAKPTLAAAQGAARYWGRKAWASAPAPLPHVPAPAPGPVRAARPGVGKMMASWAHQAAAQVTGTLKTVPWPRALPPA